MKSSGRSSSSSSIPSIYKPSPLPSRIYHPQNTKNEPQVVQTQSTLGQYVKQGLGTYFGWRIGTIIFGSGRSEEIHKTNTYIVNSASNECEDYKELLNKCLKNGGEDCSKYLELLKKCKEINRPELTYS